MKPKARLVTFAWGETYLAKLLELAIPAALAPGNYPYLAEHFDTEFVLVTETRFFDRVREHAAFRRLSEIGPAKLLPVDDLLIGPGSYGYTLSMAIFRGMQDLGPRMTEVAFLYLNSDFILADDSYRSLVPKLLAGERLVLSPSYCTNEEDVVPILVGERGQRSEIACAKRVMAGHILRNLHDTVRGQLIDGPFHYDQVYIYQQYCWPDPRTLVGHQMPIAIVAMRPTHEVTGMRTFWDFGAASHFCPGVAPCVLGDSDDFLMLELRARATGRDLLRIGPRRPEKVVERIGAVLTHDQLEFGKHPLVLHSGELGSNVEEAEARLRAYRERIRAGIPEGPAQHLDHAMWLYHEALHLKAAAAAERASARHRSRGAAGPATPSKDDIARRESGYIDDFFNALALGLETWQSKELDATIERLVAALVPSVRENRDTLADLEACRTELAALARRHAVERTDKDRALQRVRGVMYGRNFGDLIALIRAKLPEMPEIEVNRIVEKRDANEGVQVQRRGLLGRVFELLLGRPPNLSFFHPYRYAYRQALDALREHSEGASNILVVAGGPVMPESVFSAAGRRFTTLDWHTCTESRLRLDGGEAFDLVYCELELRDVPRLAQFFRNMREIAASGARIVVQITNLHRGVVAEDDRGFIEAVFAAIGPVRASFANGKLAGMAFHNFVHSLSRPNPKSPWNLLRLGSAMLYCLPLSAMVYRRGVRDQPGREWISLTVEAWLP